jgi:Sec-independent protein translocase protein TatA
MAFGSELIMMAGLGFVVLGPKRMQVLLGQVARIRSEIDKASRGLKAQLSEELQGSEGAETTAEFADCSACAHPSDLQKDAPAPQ